MPSCEDKKCTFVYKIRYNCTTGNWIKWPEGTSDLTTSTSQSVSIEDTIKIQFVFLSCKAPNGSDVAIDSWVCHSTTTATSAEGSDISVGDTIAEFR